MSSVRAVHFVLTREDPTGKCVVVEDPNDPGGLTCCGISLKRHPELSEADIRSMTWEKAGLIYSGLQYWGAVRGDLLPGYLQTAMLDSAVNQGASIAIRSLQEAIYVHVDGDLGPETFYSLSRTPQDRVLARLAARRIVHYSRDSDWPNAASSWVERAIAATLDAYVG